MKQSTKRLTVCALIALSACLAAANQSPAVSAGEDLLTASTGVSSYLIGDVNDAETPYDSLNILWRQIAGPAQSTIVLPASATTGVTFPDSGTYLFELSVSDGSAMSRDTVMVRVRRHLPFVLLNPADVAPVERGRPYVIRWQMDPSIPCTVWFTVDEGLNWTMLTELGSVTDSFVWEVPATLAAGTRGQVKVHEYMNSSNQAEGSGEFVIVNEGSAIAREYPGAVRTIPGAAVKGRTDGLFSFDGRCLGAIAGRAQSATPFAAVVRNKPGSHAQIVNRSTQPSTRRTR